jgi:hypothetical protein
MSGKKDTKAKSKAKSPSKKAMETQILNNVKQNASMLLKLGSSEGAKIMQSLRKN